MIEVKDKTFVFTGKILRGGYDRVNLELKVSALGGTVMPRLTGSIDYLVVGHRPGTIKLKAAEDLGVRMITEDEFWRAMNDRASEIQHATWPDPAKAAEPHIDKTMIYLRGWAKGFGFGQFALALQWVTIMHEGQFRNSGEPYATHPVRVAAQLQALGFMDDAMLAAAVLHDVIEDTSTPIDAFATYGFSDDTMKLVIAMTKLDEMSVETYFERLRNCPRAGIIKIADRCHNMSTAFDCFTFERMGRFITETEDYVYPLIKDVRRAMPEHEEKIFALKYHLVSVVDVIKTARKKEDQAS